MIYLFCILNTFIKSKQDTENLSIPSREVISKEKPNVTEKVIQGELTLFGINIENRIE